MNNDEMTFDEKEEMRLAEINGENKARMEWFKKQPVPEFVFSIEDFQEKYITPAARALSKVFRHQDQAICDEFIKQSKD